MGYNGKRKLPYRTLSAGQRQAQQDWDAELDRQWRLHLADCDGECQRCRAAVVEATKSALQDFG